MLQPRGGAAGFEGVAPQGIVRFVHTAAPEGRRRWGALDEEVLQAVDRIADVDRDLDADEQPNADSDRNRDGGDNSHSPYDGDGIALGRSRVAPSRMIGEGRRFPRSCLCRLSCHLG